MPRRKAGVYTDSEARSTMTAERQEAVIAREALRGSDPMEAAWLDYVDLSTDDYTAAEMEGVEVSFKAGWSAGHDEATAGAKELVLIAKRFYDAEREWILSLEAFQAVFPGAEGLRRTEHDAAVTYGSKAQSSEAEPKSADASHKAGNEPREGA